MEMPGDCFLLKPCIDVQSLLDRYLPLYLPSASHLHIALELIPPQIFGIPYIIPQYLWKKGGRPCEPSWEVSMLIVALSL